MELINRQVEIVVLPSLRNLCLIIYRCVTWFTLLLKLSFWYLLKDKPSEDDSKPTLSLEDIQSILQDTRTYSDQNDVKKVLMCAQNFVRSEKDVKKIAQLIYDKYVWQKLGLFYSPYKFCFLLFHYIPLNSIFMIVSENTFSFECSETSREYL